MNTNIAECGKYFRHFDTTSPSLGVILIPDKKNSFLENSCLDFRPFFVYRHTDLL